MRVYACVCVYIYIYIYVHIHLSPSLSLSIYIYIYHRHTHIHIMHIYIYIYMCSLVRLYNNSYQYIHTTVYWIIVQCYLFIVCYVCVLCSLLLFIISCLYLLFVMYCLLFIVFFRLCLSLYHIVFLPSRGSRVSVSVPDTISDLIFRNLLLRNQILDFVISSVRLSDYDFFRKFLDHSTSSKSVVTFEVFLSLNASYFLVALLI